MSQAVLDRLYALRNAAAGFQLQVEDVIREVTATCAIATVGGICKATGGEHPRDKIQNVSTMGDETPRYRCSACSTEWTSVS